MKHQFVFRRLGRPTAHRKALFRNLITSLVKHNRIVTTHAKAKEVQPLADRFVTWCKQQNLVYQRRVFAYLYDHKAAETAWRSFHIRFAERNGGYTRVLAMQKKRQGDNARMAVIEFLDQDKIPQTGDVAASTTTTTTTTDTTTSTGTTTANTGTTDTAVPPPPNSQDRFSQFEHDVPRP